MRMLDLFSGIGGFSLAATWVWGDELEIVAFVEIDPFCQKVLHKHWPNVPIEGDIKNVDGTKWTGTIDLLTGGFPCQPFSVAGKRKGQKDDRFLWPEMFRVIKESRPNWIVGENVDGIDGMALDEVLVGLETIGYEVAPPLTIPALAVDAEHKRNRKWIIANSSGGRLQGQIQIPHKNEGIYASTSNYSPFETFRQRFYAKGMCGDVRIGDGIPNWVDRLKSLGNAIVPQVAYQIMKAIKEIKEV